MAPKFSRRAPTSTALAAALRAISMVVFVAIGFLWVGYDPSQRKLAGGYALERFNEGGTSYYLTESGSQSSGGGVFEGTVQAIGWNKDWILGDVNKCYKGDTNGWYALNLKTRKVIGPIQESDIRKNQAFSVIKCRKPSDIFAGKI